MPEQEPGESQSEEKFNPQLQESIERRREASMRALERHGAERLEGGELVLTQEQIERIKKEGERFPDQQLYELYDLASETLMVLTKLQPSGIMTEEEQTRYDQGGKKEKARIERETAAREKAGFLSGEIENPHFTYPLLERSKLDLDQVSRNLRDIKRIIKWSKADPNLRALYQEKINEKIAEVEMLRAVKRGDDKRFYRYSRFIYGEPDEGIYQAALAEVTAYQPGEPTGEEKVTDEVIKKSFEAALKAYGWKREVKTARRKAVISAGRKSVIVPKGREETVRHLKELIAHEIETHVLRKESSRRAPLRIIRETTLGKYLPTEEGLAVQAEERVNQELGAESKRPEFAVRLIGLSLAKTHNFRGTYTELQRIYQEILEKEKNPQPEEKSRDLAYNLTHRIFRGVHHPEQPGHFFTKDWVYYKGNLDVAHFISQGGDIAQLYIGKIGLHHLSILTELGISTKPAITPRFVVSRIEVLPS